MTLNRHFYSLSFYKPVRAHVSGRMRGAITKSEKKASDLRGIFQHDLLLYYFHNTNSCNTELDVSYPSQNRFSKVAVINF